MNADGIHQSYNRSNTTDYTYYNVNNIHVLALLTVTAILIDKFISFDHFNEGSLLKQTYHYRQESTQLGDVEATHCDLT